MKKEFQAKVKKIFPIYWGLRKISDMYESFRNPHSFSLPINILKGWSVVVITDGNNPESLSKLIHSVQVEFSETPYEIIIVGPHSLSETDIDTNLHTIPYKELNIIEGWVTRKKNLGVEVSKFENLVICHDYVILVEGWKKGFDMMGDSFDVCVNKVLNKNGMRHYDWITLDYPNIGNGLLPYHAECTEYQYIGGNYMVVKRDFYLKYPLDEKLRWGEAEDIKWSKEIRKHTKFKFNPYSTVTYSKQKSTIGGEWIENTKKLEEIFKKQ